MKLALVIVAVLGLGSALPTPRDLQSDLEDIVGIIPLDEIRAIARRYAETDVEFQEVVRYLQGPEWANLVDTVGNHPTWIRFKDYMLEAGVDVNGVIEFLHDLIAGVEVPAGNAQIRSVRDFVDEVKALIDTGALLAALNDKLTNSADFQEFFEKISSDDARDMVEEIRALDEVQRIAQRLREMGIDVDYVVDLIFGLLGWTKKATRDLQSDLEDIVGIIPLDEIRAIARRYAETDAEFQDVVRYLQGPEWANLVDTVGNHPTWIRFKDYMLEAGVDVNGVIEFLHDLIAGVEVPKGKAHIRSVRDFVDEVKALIDTGALLAALNDKLTNSADFQEFFEKISSDDARDMVEEIRALEEVQRIAQRLREMGIDVDYVVDLIFGLLGWTKKATRDLQSDLEDIVGIIPLDEIRAIARRYAETDAEFQDVVRYLQGPEWANLVDTVGNHPTWIRFKDYMLEAGVDVNGVIEFLHDLIAGVEVPAGNAQIRSVRDFVDEVKALIDTGALLAALNDKLTNSADFQEFFEKISSDDARDMVEEIRALDEVQRIAQRLREMGIDVDYVVDLIFGLLGWTKKATRDLQSDLEDIVGIIPLDEIRAIARRYAETDAEFQDVVRYLQGPEWANLVDTVGNHPTWIRFKDYMLDAGVDVNGVIEFLHDLIAGVEVPAGNAQIRSVRDFVDEVKALIDTGALLAALNDKLTNSADFQEFFEKISSDDARDMVEEIRALEEVQRIAQRLREMGIDVDYVVDLIFGLLGWTKKATRDLQSDLEDIVGIIPLDEIRAIARRYAETDAEFQDVVRYLQGPEWANLVDTVGNHPTWIRFKDYMLEAGVDVNGVIEFLHDLIAGVEVPKGEAHIRSVRDFVDEVKALIDTGALLEALNDKLTNSADFQEFFEKISSDDARDMVEEIRALDQVQYIAQRLREMGIDVDYVVDLIFGLLGWTK